MVVVVVVVRPAPTRTLTAKKRAMGAVLSTDAATALTVSTSTVTRGGREQRKRPQDGMVVPEGQTLASCRKSSGPLLFGRALAAPRVCLRDGVRSCVASPPVLQQEHQQEQKPRPSLGIPFGPHHMENNETLNIVAAWCVKTV